MGEKDIKHYIDTLIHLVEKTYIYARIKGAQFFKELDIDVTIDQFIALDAIYCNKDICQRDLSKIILKDRSNTGRILNILEEKGFIKREIETKGKRMVKKVYITGKGKNLIEEYIPKLCFAFIEIFDEMSEEELTILRAHLEMMRACLSKTTSIQI